MPSTPSRPPVDRGIINDNDLNVGTSDAPSENENHEEPDQQDPDRVSHASSSTQSRVRQYHQQLRYSYVLQTLREDDLLNYSPTQIPNQRIYETADGMHIYHADNPEIIQPIRPIEDEELHQENGHGVMTSNI
ncbi:hypothetical protein K435DRAFT_873088 [Dendrothele bispora CBS 962.96]|uniref:Uncharacterized protein n=1 Tax=Dendrothele bispora (strain CBS 962.96) TaxID=1314807 RepID=A0A4S8KZX5_DENBC|nr:hypothetical protein K435DRAFT_873088 [Dendrothele bispora CBS 962.96]